MEDTYNTIAFSEMSFRLQEIKDEQTNTSYEQAQFRIGNLVFSLFHAIEINGKIEINESRISK